MLGLLLLGGCAGYVADHVSGKDHVIRPQLARFGLGGNACVALRLEAGLDVQQTRRLADLAARLSPGGANAATLGPREFAYVAGLIEEAEVGLAVTQALAACGVSTATPRATPESGPLIMTQMQSLPPPGPATMAALWVNLGSARTGQGIAVDAASVTRGPSWRKAWFRLLNGNAPGATDFGYLLQVDCDARTITAFGGREYGPGGQLIEQKDYAKPEGPLPIEPGTVMDVAFQSLCYDPK